MYNAAISNIDIMTTLVQVNYNWWVPSKKKGIINISYLKNRNLEVSALIVYKIFEKIASNYLLIFYCIWLRVTSNLNNFQINCLF